MNVEVHSTADACPPRLAYLLTRALAPKGLPDDLRVEVVNARESKGGVVYRTDRFTGETRRVWRSGHRANVHGRSYLWYSRLNVGESTNEHNPHARRVKIHLRRVEHGASFIRGKGYIGNQTNDGAETLVEIFAHELRHCAQSVDQWRERFSRERDADEFALAAVEDFRRFKDAPSRAVERQVGFERHGVEPYRTMELEAWLRTRLVEGSHLHPYLGAD